MMRIAVIISFIFIIASGLRSERLVSGLSPELSNDTLTLGAPLKLQLKIPVSSGVEILPPDREDFYPLSVITLKTQRIEGKNLDTLVLNAEITRYDIDSTYIPKMPFIVNTQDDTTKGDTIFSEKRELTLKSVITAQKGDTVSIRDLKPLQEAGSPPPVLLWIAIVLLSIGIIILLVILLGNYRNHAKETPIKPPYDEAVEALKRLSMKKMVENGLYRAYVFEISAILKRYLGRRYNINASEFTTDEMIHWAENHPFKRDISEIVQNFFKSVHPVKFAKITPEKSEIEGMTKTVWEIIEGTRPNQEEESGV